ncbi:MAG: hypothetical protein U1E56_07095 [Bauldia sp.]
MRARAKPFAIEIKQSRKNRSQSGPGGIAEAPKRSWAAGLLDEIERETAKVEQSAPADLPPPAAALAPRPVAAPAPRILQDLTTAPAAPAAEAAAETPYARVRQIDKERRRVVADAKRDAMRAARRAIEALNELGFAYSLVEESRSRGGD